MSGDEHFSPNRRDSPHDDQIARARLVAQYCDEGDQATTAAVRAAEEQHVSKRTIYRAKKYQEAFAKLPADIQEIVRPYVNDKMLPVEYVYTEFAQLGEPQMRQAVVQWANGDFPGVTRKVSVPESDGAEGETPSEEPVRRSYHIQALVAKCGEEMGLTVWLPRHDRNAVLREWKPKHGSLVDSLVLRMSNDEETDENCRKTIEQIDVVWLKRGSIVRAFEIEESTHIYSGLLRMADLLALSSQPEN